MLKYIKSEKEVAIAFAKDIASQKVFEALCENNSCAIHDEIRKLPYKVLFSHGATRCVFFKEDGTLNNWVLKVDYLSNKKEYSRLEAKYYKEAVNRGVDWAFAATYFLDSIDGIDFYIQERLDCSSNYEITSLEILKKYLCEELGFERQDYEDEDCFDSRLIDYISYDLEPESVLDCLITDYEVEQFVEDFDINDLHMYNFGMTEDGCFKIVDYCGYYE